MFEDIIFKKILSSCPVQIHVKDKICTILYIVLYPKASYPPKYKPRPNLETWISELCMYHVGAVTDMGILEVNRWCHKMK